MSESAVLAPHLPSLQYQDYSAITTSTSNRYDDPASSSFSSPTSPQIHPIHVSRLVSGSEEDLNYLGVDEQSAHSMLKNTSSEADFSLVLQQIRRRQLLTVLSLMLLLLLVGIVYVCSWIILSDNVGQAQAFFLDLIITVSLIVFQLPILWQQWWTNQLNETDRFSQLPWRPLLLISTLDSLYDSLSSLGSPYTPGGIQNILFQLAIPMIMILSYVILKRKYLIGQYIGGTIIVSGCILSVAPSIMHSLHGETDSGNAAVIKAPSIGFVVLAVFFGCLSTVYKEAALKGTEINIWLFSIIDCGVNLVITIILIPILWIPGLGNDTPSSTFPHILGGMRCLFLGKTTDTVDPLAVCDSMWYLLLINAGSLMLLNILSYLLIRKSSALLPSIVSGIQLPIVQLFLSMRLIMGKHVTQMTVFMWIGLLVVMIGFTIYTFLPFYSDNKNANHDGSIGGEGESERVRSIHEIFVGNEEENKRKAREWMKRGKANEEEREKKQGDRFDQENEEEITNSRSDNLLSSVTSDSLMYE